MVFRHVPISLFFFLTTQLYLFHKKARAFCINQLLFPLRPIVLNHVYGVFHLSAG